MLFAFFPRERGPAAERRNLVVVQQRQSVKQREMILRNGPVLPEMPPGRRSQEVRRWLLKYRCAARVHLGYARSGRPERALRGPRVRLESRITFATMRIYDISLSRGALH